MLLSSLLRNGKRRAPAAEPIAQTSPAQPAAAGPRVEPLEGRCLFSGYEVTALAGYDPADPVNANLSGWGMASMPGGAFAVANTFSDGSATVYGRSGDVRRTINVPVADAPPLGVTGPTGVVYNRSSRFVITDPETGKSAPARLIFNSIDGTISGWNPRVDPANAITILDTTQPDNGVANTAVYTGLTMARSQGRTVLYAADVLNNEVDMFVDDRHANGLRAVGTFTNPDEAGVLGGGRSAWQVKALDDKLYVTYANPLARGHGGALDVFDLEGNLLTPDRFAANDGSSGPLANPWGIARAPKQFGDYGGALLVGNVSGAINAFDPHTGDHLGALEQPDGTPISIPGLWELEFASGRGDGDGDGGKQLFFAAGPRFPGDFPNGKGLFGSITVAQQHDEDHDPDDDDELFSSLDDLFSVGN